MLLQTEVTKEGIKEIIPIIGVKSLPEKPITRENILACENAIRKIPWSVEGEELDKLCPLKHTFANGCYIREIFMPKGTLLTSKIHKIDHPYFVLKGDVSVLTEEGVVRIRAPYSGITKAGTKRVLYIHEDCIWITVHITFETDLKKIEEQIIAKTYDDLPNSIVEGVGEILKLEEKK